MRLGFPSRLKSFVDIPRACYSNIVDSAKERVTNLWGGVKENWTYYRNLDPDNNAACAAILTTTSLAIISPSLPLSNLITLSTAGLAFSGGLLMGVKGIPLANRLRSLPTTVMQSANETAEKSLEFFKKSAIDAASYVEGKSKPHITPLLVNVTTSASFTFLISYRPEVMLAKFAYRWVLPPSVALGFTAVLISGYARTYKPSKEALAEPIILFRKGQRTIEELFAKTEPQENSPSLIETKFQAGKEFLQKAIQGDAVLFQENGGETTALQTSLVVAELALLYFAGFSTPTLADQAFWNTVALSTISSTGAYLISQMGKIEPAALPVQQIDSNLVYRGES